MNEDRTGSMDQGHAGEHEDGQLTKQTPGLDEGVTDAIAGPDWDQDLVDDARTSVEGEPMEGEVERGPSDPASSSDDATSSDGGTSSDDLGVGDPFGPS